MKGREAIRGGGGAGRGGSPRALERSGAGPGGAGVGRGVAGMAAPRAVLLLSGKRKSGKDFVAAEIQKRYRGWGGYTGKGKEGGGGGGRYRCR